jgi:hypothetical protein
LTALQTIGQKIFQYSLLVKLECPIAMPEAAGDSDSGIPWKNHFLRENILYRAAPFGGENARSHHAGDDDKDRGPSIRLMWDGCPSTGIVRFLDPSGRAPHKWAPGIFLFLFMEKGRIFSCISRAESVHSRSKKPVDESV